MLSMAPRPTDMPSRTVQLHRIWWVESACRFNYGTFRGIPTTPAQALEDSPDVNVRLGVHLGIVFGAKGDFL